MAPKKSRVIDNPPSPSPDHEDEPSEVEEEEEPSEAEEEESGEEEEEGVQTPQKPPAKTHHQQKPKSPSPSSSEEEEEGSDDDGTKSSPTASDFTIKPVATHTTKNTTKNQQPIKTKESEKPSSKRRLELQKDGEKKSPIKKKSKIGAEIGEETKRVAVNHSGGGVMVRVWGEDDEIAVLKGMIDYQSQKGADPREDLGAFLEFMKGKFQFDVTKTQLYEKLRRLKKKFLNNVTKGENGKDPVFSKPHEFSSFELSKKIWGTPDENVKTNGEKEVDKNSKGNDGKAKKAVKVQSTNGKMKEDGEKNREVEDEEEEEEEDEEVQEDDDNMIVEKEVVKEKVATVHEVDFASKYRYLSESYDARDLHMSETLRKFMKENTNLIGHAKAKDLDEKWKKLRIQEIELFYKGSKLMIEQTKLVMDAMKKR